MMVAAVLAVASPARADSRWFSPEWFAGPWTVTLGAEGRVLPTYEGSSNYRFLPVPLFDIRRAGTPRHFQSPRDGASIGIVEFDNFRLGPTLKVRLPRREGDDAKLRGLGDVNFAVELGGFAEYWFTPWLRARGELRQGVSGHHGLTGDLAHDIDAICTGTPRAVSLAEVNGRRFHSNAGFGLMSTMARERENARRAFPFSRALGFVAAGLRTLFTYRPIEVELGEGEKRRQFYADTVLVTSNHFEGMPWRRPNLEGRLLEVHLLEAGGLSARLKLLWLAAQGRWRDHDRLTSFTATRFIVRRRKKRSVALSIDGEACRLHGPIVFNVAPETLYLHAPDT